MDFFFFFLIFPNRAEGGRRSGGLGVWGSVCLSVYGLRDRHTGRQIDRDLSEVISLSKTSKGMKGEKRDRKERSTMLQYFLCTVRYETTICMTDNC